MPIIQTLRTRRSPGVYVDENTYGSIPALLADHGTVYVLGTCTGNSIPFNTPTYIANYQDFISRAISSPSAAAIDLFFNQRSGSGLMFVRVPAKQQSNLTAVAATVGLVNSVTISGTTISYTSVTGDTLLTIVDKLGALVNQQLPGVADYVRVSPSVAFILTAPSTVLTASANITLVAPVVNSAPRPYDVQAAIGDSFVPENPQGYLVAPEFFQAYTALADRTALQLAMEAICADPRFYWVSVVDMGEATATSTVPVNAAQTERATYASPRGNSWVSYPYVKNLLDANVPSSLALVGVALRRARSEGFAQPPAGTAYPIYGIKGLSVNITSDIQDQLNPLGINCLRTLPGRGTVVYGARTLSTSPFYIFAATRVILNVLAGSLRNSFDGVVFSLVDGQGVLFSRIKQTAANLCERLRLGGALYGSSPEEAYLVICDSTNNLGDSLDQGLVNLDVIVKPSPTLEALNITLSRASLATTLVEIQAAGDTASIQKG